MLKARFSKKSPHILLINSEEKVLEFSKNRFEIHWFSRCYILRRKIEVSSRDLKHINLTRIYAGGREIGKCLQHTTEVSVP